MIVLRVKIKENCFILSSNLTHFNFNKQNIKNIYYKTEYLICFGRLSYVAVLIKTSTF